MKLGAMWPLQSKKKKVIGLAMDSKNTAAPDDTEKKQQQTGRHH
jgi:hypothetical protein